MYISTLVAPPHAEFFCCRLLLLLATAATALLLLLLLLEELLLFLLLLLLAVDAPEPRERLFAFAFALDAALHKAYPLAAVAAAAAGTPLLGPPLLLPLLLGGATPLVAALRWIGSGCRRGSVWPYAAAWVVFGPWVVFGQGRRSLARWHISVRVCVCVCVRVFCCSHASYTLVHTSARSP